MPQNLSAQIVCPSPKVCDFYEKSFHWASIVRDSCVPYINYPWILYSVTVFLLQSESSKFTYDEKGHYLGTRSNKFKALEFPIIKRNLKKDLNNDFNEKKN